MNSVYLVKLQVVLKSYSSADKAGAFGQSEHITYDA